MEKKRYTAAIVGGGGGGMLSLNALLASDRYQVLAIADINPETRCRLAEKYPELRIYPGWREMFVACPTEVVCVSTWPPSHHEVVMAALETLPELKGLLCEKPLADTTARGRSILSAVEQRRLPVVVPHGMLQMRHTLEILDRVRQGDIGTLELVEIECHQWDIINAGIHWVNYFVHLTLGDPVVWVLAAADTTTQTYRDGMEVETAAVTYAQTAGGVRLVMHTGDEVKIKQEVVDQADTIFRLIGSKGLIHFWGWRSAYWLQNAAYPEGRLFNVPPFAEPGHRRYLESLAVQMDSGSCEYEIPRTSLAALEVCEAAYLSIEHHCQVNLPLERFTPPGKIDWHPGKPYRGVGGRNGRLLD